MNDYSIAQNISDSNRIGVEFLITDVQTEFLKSILLRRIADLEADRVAEAVATVATSDEPGQTENSPLTHLKFPLAQKWQEIAA